MLGAGKREGGKDGIDQFRPHLITFGEGDDAVGVPVKCEACLMEQGQLSHGER